MKPLSAKEASEVLGISPRAIYALAAPAGPIPCLRFGRAVRFDRKDVEAYRRSIAAGNAPAAPDDLELAEIAARSVLVPRVCGIYFLFRFGQLVYIGSAINIARRIGQHSTEKDFDSYSFLECAPADRLRLESIYILRLRPPLNKHYRPPDFEFDPADEITIERGDMREMQ